MTDKKVVGITGSSGLIGSSIAGRLKDKGFTIRPLLRNFNKVDIDECDIIINLAGASINQRWNKRNRSVILNSRVETTRKLKELISQSGKPSLLISASAVGIYPSSCGMGSEEVYNEYSPERAANFLGEVCVKWEEEALVLKDSLRLAIIRLGVVLTSKGGALPKMAFPFRMGIAGRIGSGMQPFSWVSLEDLLCAIEFIISNNELSGIFNITSPKPVTNSQLTDALAIRYKSFIRIKIPLLIFRAIYGKSSVLITEGQYASPKRLSENGFEFKLPDISEAIR
jgi:uncharacterized protein (TIGR01777 family)